MSDLKSRLVSAVQLASLQAPSAPADASGLSGGSFIRDQETQKQQAAVLVACLARPEPSVVLTVRANGVPQHAGQVALPGGRRHPGESFPEATALREAHEEVGLDPSEATVLGVLPPVSTLTGYTVSPVVAWVDRPVGLIAHEREVSQIFLWPLAEVLNLDRYSTHQVRLSQSGRVHRYQIWRLQGGQWPIWGATAEVLSKLAQR